MNSAADYLAELRPLIDQALVDVLDGLAAPGVIVDPVRYALLGPGKRLRPCLVLAAADAIAESEGRNRDETRLDALPAACAVEMVHTYSLVHDDLPAMDNDDLRRGRPTTHVVYREGLAILAGDGLVTDAFQVLASWQPRTRVLPEAPSQSGRRLRAIAMLAEAAGMAGMVGGQAIDLAAAGQAGTSPLTLGPSALEDMHARKTGALIRAATGMGAVLAGASEPAIAAIDAYATDLGLAFQIVDDVLDVEGSAGALGKTAGKDAAAGKPTFPALYGLDESKRRAAACVERAKDALVIAGLGGRLSDIADWSLRRTH